MTENLLLFLKFSDLFKNKIQEANIYKFVTKEESYKLIIWIRNT